MAFRLDIPDEATGCTVLIRHAKSVQGGTNESRTLRVPEGTDLCKQVLPFWNQVVGSLGATFGDSSYYSSTYPRSFLTVWLIFHPEQIVQIAKLAIKTSLKKVQNGEWFKARKAEKMSVPQMIQTFVGDTTLWEGQPFKEDRAGYLSFITSNTSGLHVAGVHEAALSLVAQGHIPDDQLGLNECEGVAFYTADGKIIGAQKLVPPTE
ncbi:MAG: hypothetical protein V1853_00085 [bacterium]